MRELGFSKKWAKLHVELPIGRRPEFTTFRMPRKDSDKGRDWHQAERVKVVYHPRNKDREVLGVADIILKEPRTFGIAAPPVVTEDEAIADGFSSWVDMFQWFDEITNEEKDITEIINKLTLRWVSEPEITR